MIYINPINRKENDKNLNNYKNIKYTNNDICKAQI